jgi:hypothetical protein
VTTEYWLCHRVLKPGGWLQFVELYLIAQSDNGTITSQHAVGQLNDQFIRFESQNFRGAADNLWRYSSLDNTRDIRAPLRFDSMFKEAGLVEVEKTVINVPLSAWHTGMYCLAIYSTASSYDNEISGYLIRAISTNSSNRSHMVWERSRIRRNNLRWSRGKHNDSNDGCRSICPTSTGVSCSDKERASEYLFEAIYGPVSGALPVVHFAG